MRYSLAALPLGVVLVITACGDDSAPTKSIAESRQQSFDLYGRWVDETDARYSKCLDDVEATGTCVITNPANGRTLTIVVTGVSPTGLREQISKARRVAGMVRQLLTDAKGKMCEVVAPFARLQHPYFFYGVGGAAGVGAAATGAVEVYYDLWNQQSAVFTSLGVSAGTTSGVEANAYMGYAFGDKPNVIDAGGGRQCAASGALGIKAIAGVSVTGSVFSSPDGTVVGGSVGVGVGVGAFELPVDATVGVSDAGPWDAATRALGDFGFGYRSDIVPDANGNVYVQYNGAVDMAIALLWNLPPPQSVAVATQVLAIAALKETGLTIEQACPNEVAAVPPPSLGLVGDACNALPNLRGDAPPPGGGTSSGGPGAEQDGGRDAGLDPTDCGDKTDGWWCFGFGTGYMAYCQGKQIAGGCGCASCSVGGTPAGCGAAPPPAACPP
jgi:hypothetical protein